MSKSVEKIEVEGAGKRGRPRKKLSNCANIYMRETRLRGDEWEHRGDW